MELTRKEAIRRFREQWLWMSENACNEEDITKAKELYFKKHPKLKIPVNNCYLCEKVINCYQCLIKWENGYCYYSEYADIYTDWISLTPRQRKNRIIKIANLPENL